MRRFVWFVLALPIAELIGTYLLWSQLGLLPTVAWIVLSTLTGSALLRRTLAQGGLGRILTEPKKLLFGIAAALLLFPGPCSDLLAIVILLPPGRQYVLRWLGGRLPRLDATVDAKGVRSVG
jgi:UPF0716 protein FxsA